MTGYRRRGVVYAPRSAAAHAVERHIRAPWSLPLFASLASLALVLVMLVEPTGAAHADPLPVRDDGDLQSVTSDGTTPAVARDGFQITKVAPPRPSAPPIGTPDPGTAQAIAYELVLARGWDQAEFDCLVALWNHESHWNVYAANKSSGAYGIPQALPGSKMASVGADWQTNPRTQIIWGLGYVAGRYGTPCGAWGHFQSKHWY